MKLEWLENPLIAAAICIPLSFALVNLFTNNKAVSCHENGGLWQEVSPNVDERGKCVERTPQ